MAAQKSVFSASQATTLGLTSIWRQLRTSSALLLAFFTTNELAS
jgi:hypothetical protein